MNCQFLIFFKKLSIFEFFDKMSSKIGQATYLIRSLQEQLCQQLGFVGATIKPPPQNPHIPYSPPPNSPKMLLTELLLRKVLFAGVHNTQ